MTFSKLGTDTDTRQPVYLPKASRLQGLYIIGIQGTGKSGLIENLIMQDIDQQIGVCVLDPHGELIDHVIARLPGKTEEEKVILLDIADYTHPFGLNLFECPDPTDDGEIVKTLYQVLHVFEKAYGIVPTTPLMYDLLYHTVYTLIANPEYTMIDIRLLLTNEACRKKLAANVPNDDIQDFWRIWDDPKQTSPSKQQEDRKTILNKMNDFLHVPLRNIVGQSKTTFDLEDIMNTGKILLVKLSRRLEQPSNLIGSIIIAQLLNAAYARPTNKRKQFHLYADEFQNFATEDFATLLEEARKFGIGTTIAHQNRGQLNSANSQLETDLKDRSRSVGNMVVFKINSKDADELVGEFKITPQAAWEEEIEKEWVEVLKPEWYERVEEEVIDGEEEIKTPVKDVVHHLLNGGQHTSDVVNQFAHGTLAKMQPVFRDNKHSYVTSSLNTFLYRAMIGSHITASDLEGFIKELCFACNMYSFGYAMTYEQNSLPAFSTFWNSGYASTLYQIVRLWIREKVKEQLTRELEELGRTLAVFHQQALDAKRLSVAFIPLQELLPSLKQYYASEKPLEKRLNVFGLPDVPTWFSVDIDQLQWQQVERTYPPEHPYYMSITTSGWTLLPHQEWKFYRESDLDAATDKLFWDDARRFEAVIAELNAVCQALAAQPIEVDSGLTRPRKRKQINYHTHPPQTLTHPRKVIMHPQRTYQDVQNELATHIVSLPNYSARVKIGVNATHNPGKKCLSCKILNNSGALNCTGCGKQLPAPNEYILTTLKPATGMNTQQLEQRIKRIQGRNLQQGSLRDRKTVEVEITQRQTSCSGSSPAQPQPQQPTPQQAQARHARQVPVQGKCPNCGAVNSSNAKFCNQCGTNLH